MDVMYQRDMNHNYMILQCKGGLDEESFETKMIFSNKIPGLLPCHIRYVDDRTYLGYEVTSRQSLALFCENRKPGKRELRNILGSILRTISGLDEYLLGPDHLILDPKLIMMNFETQEAALPFAPFYRKDIRNSLRELAEYLLSFISHDDQQGIVLGYRFSHELLEKNTGISGLMDILYEKKRLQHDEDPHESADSFLNADSCFSEVSALPESYEVIRDPFLKPPASGETAPGSCNSVADETFGPSRRERKSKSLKRAFRVILGGIAGAATAYAAIHFLPEFLSETDGIAYRIAAALALCAAAVAAGSYLRKSRRGEYCIDTVKERDNESQDAERKRRNREGSDEIRGGPDSEIYGEGRNAAEQDSGPGRFGKADHDPVSDFPEADTETGERVTTLLTDCGEGCASAVLIPEDSSSGLSAITLSEKEILVGKQEDLVTYVIDSPAVSRIHARIRAGKNGHCIRDLNSTNGTSINGNAVFGDEEVCLRDGDRITLADAVYVYSRPAGK